MAYFGTLMAGGIVVTCSPLYKERELEHQLEDSGASIIVAARDIVRGNDLYAPLAGCRDRLEIKHVISTSVTDYLPPLKKRLAGLAGVRNVARKDTTDFVSLLRRGPIEPPAEADPENDVALLQYTGGTTGVSKGAMLTHYNLYSNAVRVAEHLPLTPDDVSLAVLPLFHIYGMTVTMNMPISVGAAIVLLPSFHVEEVAKSIEKLKVTTFSGAPVAAYTGSFSLKAVSPNAPEGAPGSSVWWWIGPCRSRNRSASRALLAARISASTLSAISSGVSAPRSRPTGANSRARPSSSSATPSLASSERRRSVRRRGPSRPM
jgi:acyl-CoA synthetase (AMP-forming)/AMP-acid ligase II